MISPPGQRAPAETLEYPVPDDSPAEPTADDTRDEEAGSSDASAPMPPTESRDQEDEPASRELIRRINRLVPGTLTFHFPQRDVSFDMAGADAARILTAHRRGRPDGLADALDPDTSLMLLDWMSVALDATLMISWTAGPDARKVVTAGLADEDLRANKPPAPGTTTAERPAS